MPRTKSIKDVPRVEFFHAETSAEVEFKCKLAKPFVEWVGDKDFNGVEFRFSGRYSHEIKTSRDRWYADTDRRPFGKNGNDLYTWKCSRSFFDKLMKALDEALGAFKKYREKSSESGSDFVSLDDASLSLSDRVYTKQVWAKGVGTEAWKVRMPEAFVRYLKGQIVVKEDNGEGGIRMMFTTDGVCGSNVGDLRLFQYTPEDSVAFRGAIRDEFQKWKTEGYPDPSEADRFEVIE